MSDNEHMTISVTFANDLLEMRKLEAGLEKLYYFFHFSAYLFTHACTHTQLHAGQSFSLSPLRHSSLSFLSSRLLHSLPLAPPSVHVFEHTHASTVTISKDQLVEMLEVKLHSYEIQ